MNRTLLALALGLGAASAVWGQSIIKDDGVGSASFTAKPAINYGAYQPASYKDAAAQDTLEEQRAKKLLEENPNSMYDSLDGPNSRLNRVKSAVAAPAQAVPEPGTMVALGAGAAIFLARKRRRKAE
jgi:hypothetical protein